MTIYHINKGIGRASSGVEYAQKYRNEIFESIGKKQKFIFMDYIAPNLTSFTQPLGFASKNIIWVFGYMAGQKSKGSTYKISEFEKGLSEPFTKKETNNVITYTLENGAIQLKAWKTNLTSLTHVETFRGSRLLSSACYTDRLSHHVYFTNGKVTMRVFYKEDGKIAYTQYYKEGEITLTVFENELLVGRNAFYQAFFKRLKFTSKDLIIIDRSLDIADALFAQQKKAKVIVVIHAEHYNDARSTSDWICWNNFYEYVFTNAHLIDCFITATARQAEKLRQDFEIMGKAARVEVIPVGNISEAQLVNKEVNRFNLMTASRLAAEKNLNILIKAVYEAKKQVPELTLTIYGSGKCKVELEKLIRKLSAETYITLKGHQNLTNIYSEYGAYVSASGSEGFGLTLLEAISNGLPMVGFDVPYGNTEFIHPNHNGFLVKKTHFENDVVALAEGITKLYRSSFDFNTAKIYSVEKASFYTNEKVSKKWEGLFQTLQD